MNHLVFSIALLLALPAFTPLAGTAHAQSVAFPTEGVLWSEYFGYGGFVGPPGYETWHFFPAGDTIIDGTMYTKVFESRDSIAQIELDSSIYRGAYRQEGGRVWWIHADSTDEFLWLDFTAEVGHVLWIPGYGCDSTDHWCALQMVAEDMIDLGDGVWRKRLKYVGKAFLDDDFEVDTLYLIEGIGASRGFLDYAFKALVEYWPVDPPPRHHLICFQNEQGMVLYQFTPSGVEGNHDCHLVTTQVPEPAISPIKLFPNPSSGLVWLEVPRGLPSINVEVRQMNGRLMFRQEWRNQGEPLDLSSFPPGAYVLLARNAHTLYRQVLIISR